MIRRQSWIFVVYFLFQHLMILFFCQLILNRVKLEHTVIYIKYIVGIVPLIYQPKTSIWNRMVISVSNSLKVLELVENDLEKIFLQKYLTLLLFASNLWKLKVNILEANNLKIRKLCKNPHQYILLLIMSHQPANFEGEGTWIANFWIDLKVENFLKI